MSEELKQAAQQAIEALDEIHAGKRHPQLALAVAHNLRRALTPCPAAQTDSMGMPTSCGKPLCSPDERHPLCKLHKPVERPAAQEGEREAPYGYCPECGAPGVMRERRPDGDDKCSNGHRYPSRSAHTSLPTQPAAQATPEPKIRLTADITDPAVQARLTEKFGDMQATPDHAPDAGKMIQATPEPVLRFCPGCGSVGDVPDTYRDCCPDGANARLIPESLAHRCHDLFRLALDVATGVAGAQSIGLGQRDVITTSDVHQRVSMPTPEAEEEDSDLVNIGRSSTKHDAEPATHASPHTPASIAFCGDPEATTLQGRDGQSSKQPATPEPVGGPIKYQPGEWYEAKDRDDLEAFFRSRLPAIREAAREHGYAIGLHGSMRRDLDLIAVPWRDGASDRDVLAHAIAMAACGITRDGPYQWEQKPLGRVAAILSCCWPRWFNEAGAGHIDLSVVDPTRAAPGVPELTDAMLVAGLKVCEPLGELIDWREGFGRDEMRAVWNDMLAAAQAKGGEHE